MIASNGGDVDDVDGDVDDVDGDDDDDDRQRVASN